MATIRRFEEIEAWQKARLLSKLIFRVSIETGLSRDFRLKDQINAAAGSVMDNIAEGFDRGSRLELVHFLTIAKGSSSEVKSQLYRLLDREYITEETFEELYQLTFEIGSMLGRWINYLNKSEIKGSKFKGRIQS